MSLQTITTSPLAPKRVRENTQGADHPHTLTHTHTLQVLLSPSQRVRKVHTQTWHRYNRTRVKLDTDTYPDTNTQDR